MIKISDRAIRTPPSPIRKLASLAAETEARGIKVIKLNIGQPDIESPAEFLDGLSFYKQKIVAYENSQGLADLCKAWTGWINRHYQTDLTQDQILITVGASEAIIFALLICCDPGDEVVVLDPTYANYVGFAAISGVKLVSVPCNPNDNFRIPALEKIAAVMSSKTKAVIICNPNNPTGAVYSRDEISALNALCKRHSAFLLMDETYREFVFDGRQPFSALEVCGKDENVIVADSLSKRFSICGARIGCLISHNKEFMAAALRIAQARLAAPTIDQIAAAHMLNTTPDSYLAGVIAKYAERRAAIAESLATLTQIHQSARVFIPDGAFYAMVQLPVDNTDDFAAFLLREFSLDGATVFVAPGGGFFVGDQLGAKMIRIAFVINREDIRRGMRILGEGLKVYMSRKK